MLTRRFERAGTCQPFVFQKDVQEKSRHLNMALDDSHIVVQSFAAAKELIKRGSLSADDKAILGSYPQETYHHKDSPVSKQDHGQFLDCT